LNVGPDAAGNIPPVQRRCLEGMGDWIQAHGSIDGTRRVQASIVKPIGSEGGDEEIGKEWVRWLRRGNELYAYIDSSDPEGQVRLVADWQTVDRTSAQSLGNAITVGENGLVDINTLSGPLPGCITFKLLDG
jgi:alpha-L-fucosidase